MQKQGYGSEGLWAGEGLPAGSYLCTGSGGWVWWAAACPPWLRGRGSARCRAPCSPPWPIRRASAGGSHSAGGWCPGPSRCKTISTGYLAKITNSSDLTEAQFILYPYRDALLPSVAKIWWILRKDFRFISCSIPALFFPSLVREVVYIPFSKQLCLSNVTRHNAFIKFITLIPFNSLSFLSVF